MELIKTISIFDNNFEQEILCKLGDGSVSKIIPFPKDYISSLEILSPDILKEVDSRRLALLYYANNKICFEEFVKASPTNILIGDKEIIESKDSIETVYNSIYFLIKKDKEFKLYLTLMKLDNMFI